MTTTIISDKRPEVQRKNCTLSVSRERADNFGYSTAEQLKHFAEGNKVPDGIKPTQREVEEFDLVEYIWTWWEVTL